MDYNLNYIDKLDLSKIKVLFLAKYAPKNKNKPPSLHSVDGIIPKYHYEIYRALRDIGFRVEPSSDFKYLINNGNRFNFIFSLYSETTFLGGEIFVPSICEYLGIPYLGPTPHIRAIAEDKHLAKVLAKHIGIPTPDWVIYRCGENIIHPDFKGPYFVKPRHGGYSNDITEDSLQDNWTDILPIINKLLEEGKDVLLEKFIPGTNITMPIIGGEKPLLLPAIHNKSLLKGEIETFTQKVFVDSSLERNIFKNELISLIIEEYVQKLFQAIQPADYIRVDFRLSSHSNHPIFIEFNSTPSLGSHSDIAVPARHVGIEHQELIKIILNNSFRRQKVVG